MKLCLWSIIYPQSSRTSRHEINDADLPMIWLHNYGSAHELIYKSKPGLPPPPPPPPPFSKSSASLPFMLLSPTIDVLSHTTRIIKMRLSTVIICASTAAAAPFSYPLPNGFPNLNATALAEVFKLAGGPIPNGPLPTSLKAGGTQALQLIAANEEFEVAYFSELLSNVTNDVPGYDVKDKDYVVKTLTAVLNVG